MTWKEWLNTENCHVALKTCIKWLEKKEYGEFLDDILTEGALWCYCKDRADEWEKNHPLEQIIFHGERAIVEFIVHRYVRYLWDHLRKKSAIKYLYARYRRVLSEDTSAKTWSKSRITYYSFYPYISKSNEFVYRLHGNFTEIGFPSDVSAKNVHKKDSLLKIARFFWDRVSELEKDQQIWLAILDLVRYTAFFVQIEYTTVSLLPGVEGENEEEKRYPKEVYEKDLNHGKTADEEELELFRSIEAERVLSIMHELARQCALRLSEKERQVVAILLGEELNGNRISLKDVATRIGFSGASGVSAARDRAYEKIKQFCIPLPGLSPYDYDKDIWAEFIKNLVEFCKTHDQNRRNK